MWYTGSGIRSFFKSGNLGHKLMRKETLGLECQFRHLHTPLFSYKDNIQCQDMHVNIILILLSRISLSSCMKCHNCSGKNCRDLIELDLGNVTRCKSDVRPNLYWITWKSNTVKADFCVHSYSVMEVTNGNMFEKRIQSVCLKIRDRLNFVLYV